MNAIVRLEEAQRKMKDASRAPGLVAKQMSLVLIEEVEAHLKTPQNVDFDVISFYVDQLIDHDAPWAAEQAVRNLLVFFRRSGGDQDGIHKAKGILDRILTAMEQPSRNFMAAAGIIDAIAAGARDASTEIDPSPEVRPGPVVSTSDALAPEAPNLPLMPHATASWLVDNTALTFAQIAEFCGIHLLEVQAIADDTAGIKYTGRDPVRANELTMDEIHAGEADESYTLKIVESPTVISKRMKGPRYTPISKRQDKPDGVAWILRHYPSTPDNAIGRVLGVTRTTIAAIRDRTHWNISNIVPKDPVALGLCRQRELDWAIAIGTGRAPSRREDLDREIDAQRDALIEQLREEREAHLAEAREGSALFD